MTYKHINIGDSPTLEMIQEYIEYKQFGLDPLQVFNKYNHRHWKTTKGQPIKTLESIINAENGVQTEKLMRLFDHHEQLSLF